MMPSLIPGRCTARVQCWLPMTESCVLKGNSMHGSNPMAVSATAGVHSATDKPRVRLSALQVNIAAAVMSLSMRGCYLGWRASPGAEHGSHISQTTSAKLVDVSPEQGHSRFPRPWSHYTWLLAVRNENARCFYESEALRGGWTIRQLDRQIQSQFYERTALSLNKRAMLRKGTRLQAN